MSHRTKTLPTRPPVLCLSLSEEAWGLVQARFGPDTFDLIFLDSKCRRGRDSLRGRRSKGKGKEIRARDHARGRREEGNRSFPFSLA